MSESIVTHDKRIDNRQSVDAQLFIRIFSCETIIAGLNDTPNCVEQSLYFDNRTVCSVTENLGGVINNGCEYGNAICKTKFGGARELIASMGIAFKSISKEANKEAQLPAQTSQFGASRKASRQDSDRISQHDKTARVPARSPRSSWQTQRTRNETDNGVRDMDQTTGHEDLPPRHFKQGAAGQTAGGQNRTT